MEIYSKWERWSKDTEDDTPERREKAEEKRLKTREENARPEVKLSVLRDIELLPEKVVFGKVVKSFRSRSTSAARMQEEHIKVSKTGL